MNYIKALTFGILITALMMLAINSGSIATVFNSVGM